MNTFIIAIVLWLTLLHQALAMTGTRPAVLDEDVNKIETQIEALIKSEKISDEKLFYLYLLGARNLRKRNLHDLAAKYYHKAFALKVEYNQNRLQGMLEFAWFLTVRHDKASLKSFLPELVHFARNFGYFTKIKTLAITLDYFAVVSSDNLLVKEVLGVDYSRFFDTNYNNHIIDRELEILMSRGEFSAVSAMYKHKSINVNSYYQHLLSFDLANRLAKKPTTHLTCQPRAREASGLEVDICRELGKSSSSSSVAWLKLEKRLSGRPRLEFLRPALVALSKI